MVTFFSKLHTQEKGATPPALLSTHPASDDRMRTLQDMINQQGRWPSQPLPYDWMAIKATSR
jgi:predicted Zn-dependent protease